jgi:hypothetical protein
VDQQLLDQLVGLVLPVGLVVAREPDVREHDVESLSLASLSLASLSLASLSTSKPINYSMSSLVGLSNNESASRLLLKLKMHLYRHGLLGAENRREQVEFYGFHSRFHLYKFIFPVKKKCWYFIAITSNCKQLSMKLLHLLLRCNKCVDGWNRRSRLSITLTVDG